jgi:hypothetical protein
MPLLRPRKNSLVVDRNQVTSGLLKDAEEGKLEAVVQSIEQSDLRRNDEDLG